MGNFFAPADCALCEIPLQRLSRFPVCPACLSAPAAATPEFCCSQCRTAFVNSAPLDEQGRCRMCRVGARGFDAAYSFGDYSGALRRLIHLLKYRRVASLDRPFGAWLAQALPLDERVDLVVPVPLHWLRELRRGFNQAELLAREISRRRGIPCVNALRRLRATPAQARMSRSQRRRNVATAFAARPRAPLAGRTVLLIDDVHTTGATLGACAVALKRAGAHRVVALTLARVDRRDSVEPFPRRRAAAAGIHR